MTYTISKKNTLTTTGTAPTGSSATIVETYSTSQQMTSGNSQTLTLSGYNGYKVTNITLSMHSNKSGGQAKLFYSTDGGNSYTYIVGNATSGVAFNNAQWNGSWSTTYVSISKDVEIYPTSSNFIIKIEATANSIYCESYSITYQLSDDTSVETTTIINAPTDFNTDMKNGTNGGTLSAIVSTNGSSITEADITWESSNNNVATIDEGGNVTLVGTGSTIIKASYAGIEGQYKPSYAQYELNVINSALSTSYLLFEDECNGSGTANDGAVWTISSDAEESTFDSTCGIHYGTNSKNVQYVQLITSDISGLVTVVKVNVRDAQETATISVTVGDTPFTCNTTPTATNTNKTFTFTGSAKGQIVIRIDRGEAKTKAIYVKSVDVSFEASTDPSISANDVNLAFDATSGTISYTITNPIEGTNLTASSNASWLTVGTPADGNIALTCEANTDEARTATVTLTYGSVSKTVTVTQAAAPVVYTTIPALFAAATSEAADVNVTFNNWVVSGVSTNGKNVFVTDNNGNGFMIFNNAGGLDVTYSVGKILSGTAVPCKLVLYNGFAEITNLDAADLTITDGGSVTTSDIALANLSGVNTGALVSYEGLTCSIDGSNYYLSDGTTSIQVYNSLYAFGSALENGKKYNITGIYQQYNAKKEILPRSAADIEEVLEASITVSSTSVSAPANGAEGIITATYNNITDVVAEVKFVAADGSTAATYDWVEAQIDEDNNITYTVSANTNTRARTAYLKVYALDDDLNDVYSDIITITQAGFVADYATLPFSYDGNGAMAGDETGVTTNGLSAYGSSPAIKFDDTNDYLILKMNEAPKALYFDIKGNAFSGGTFKVQTSADGTTYSDLATYTELTSDVQTEFFTNFATDVRYIKWIYTNKSNGNVALGNIIATNVLPTENVSVGSTGFATFSCDKALDFTGIENIYAYTATVSGKEISFTRVYQVPANTGLLLRNPAEEAATANVPVIASATLSGENALVAVSEEIASLPSVNTEDNSTNYILNKPNGKNVGFFLAAGKKVGANKAYLKVPAGVSAVKSFAEVFGGETDGVEAIENGQWTIDNAVIYNLAGQRLQKLQRGVNIVGGKKVVVK